MNNSTTTEATITKTSDGTLRLDTADGVTVDRNRHHIAQVAADLLPISYDANRALFTNLVHAIDKGANLITIDVVPCGDRFGVGNEVDVHISRNGILAEAYTITLDGGFAVIL
jgi:hypothetical protein